MVSGIITMAISVIFENTTLTPHRMTDVDENFMLIPKKYDTSHKNENS